MSALFFSVSAARAGFEVLDVLSASFPNGTDSSYDLTTACFKPAEEILLKHFSPRNDKTKYE